MPARKQLPIRRYSCEGILIFLKAYIRTITGWEEGLGKCQLASTYRPGDTDAKTF